MAYSDKTRSSISKNNLKLTADKVISILDQVRDEGKKSRRRWIWELMQNAKDIPNIFERVTIEIRLSEQALSFKHNGNPFRIDNLTGLIQQVSSKPSDNSDEETTGKFGTGFISTHLLSDVITVRGVVQEPNELPKRFELILDRSGERSEDLMPAIEAALDLVDSIDNDEIFPPLPTYAELRKEEHLDNEFYYPLTEDSSQKAASIGIEDLKITLPLTLAFIPKIKQIRVINEIANEDTNYICKVIDSSNNIQKVEIFIKTSKEEKKRCYIILHHEEVSLAVEVDDFETFNLVERDLSQPFLYRDFPLIGTETFSFPFILNGRTLYPTERRDNVLLNQDGDKNKKPIHNKEVIKSAFEASKLFVKELIERKAGNLHLAALSKLPDYGFDEESQKWYCELQKDYRDFLLEMAIIDTPQGKMELKSVWFPRFGVMKDETRLLWDLAGPLVGFENVPKKNLLLSTLFHIGTYEERESWSVQLYFEVETLLQKINEAGHVSKLDLSGINGDTPIDSFKWLNTVYEFLIRNKKVDLLDEFPVIPNENGSFKLLKELFEEDLTKPIPDEFLDILKNLDADKDWRDDLINRSINLKALDHKKLDISNITEAINEILNGEKREGNIIHKLFLRKSNALDLIVSILKIDSPDSKQESIKHQLFDFAKTLFHFPDDYIKVANSGKFDYRPAIKLFISLINESITDTLNIEGLATQMRLSKTDTLKSLNNFLGVLVSNTEYSYFLKEGNIVPNRNEFLCAYDDIHNFGSEDQRLDDSLIEILEKFNSDKSWKDILLADDISIKLPNTIKFEELAAELLSEVDRIRLENTYEQYSDQLLFLIDWCTNHKDLAQRYLLAFNELSTRIFFILTIENSIYGGRIIKMLKNKENLEVLAKISESNLNLSSLKELIQIGTELGSIEAILSHARDLQHEKNDFEFKKLIGEEVERAFLEALEEAQIDAEIIHDGWGAYDFEIKNRINQKSIFIELKSQANGSTDPIKLAVSQAKKASLKPEEFALCVLERPVNNAKVEVNYIKENLVYQSQMQDDLEEALVDVGIFQTIQAKKNQVRLRIALRDDLRVSIENSFINRSPKSFDDLIVDIKNQIL